MEFGRGVQVASVVKGGCQLNEEALAELLLQDGVANSPVAVVSVAGVYRGGKSFLLGFLLRYLQAEANARSGGLWLGDMNEPLKGFTWRGGSEPETMGLQLWSKPVHVTLPSGEQVAVLLMDTQGTFDCRSTVRECSTIFALSTLLSSVQIYNIKENIREDDLQHLQLFTAYGRLALETDNATPFQVLKFLIRDWSSDCDHPYGAEGGRQLLEKRFGICAEQAQELRELRKDIKRCFESVTCFLMPHPGLKVCKQEFKGTLSDILEDFTKSLLEFVPSILAPENLTPKMINGERVTGRDLFRYFRSYTELFNSGQLPKPTTVMRATAEVAMLSAIDNARRIYSETMESNCGPQELSMSPASLREQHLAARDAALRAFRGKRLMDNHQTIEARAVEIEQELDNRLPTYEMINEAKRQRVLGDAKQAYEEYLSNISQLEDLCLHPEDLTEAHKQAVAAAVDLFNSRRRLSEVTGDDEKPLLVQSLEERFNQIRMVNEANNTAAVTAARENYTSCMNEQLAERSCFHAYDLQVAHEEALNKALGVFNSKRSRPHDSPADSYKSHLLMDINQQFNSLEQANESKNRSAAQEAISYYSSAMRAICSPQRPCLHEEGLQEEHERIRDEALDKFRSARGRYSYDDPEDDHERQINEEITRQYQTFKDMNETSNRSALIASQQAYSRAMENSCGVGRPHLSADAFNATHRHASDLALQEFHDRRREGDRNFNDTYEDFLNEYMSDNLDYYRDINDRNEVVERRELVPSVGNLEIRDNDEAGRTLTMGAVALAAGATAMFVATGGTAVMAGAAYPVVAAEAATAAGMVAAATMNACNTIRNYFSRNNNNNN